MLTMLAPLLSATNPCDAEPAPLGGAAGTGHPHRTDTCCSLRGCVLVALAAAVCMAHDAAAGLAAQSLAAAGCALGLYMLFLSTRRDRLVQELASLAAETSSLQQARHRRHAIEVETENWEDELEEKRERLAEVNARVDEQNKSLRAKATRRAALRADIALKESQLAEARSQVSHARETLVAVQRLAVPAPMDTDTDGDTGGGGGAPLGPLRLHETQFFCREAISSALLGPFTAVLDTGNASTTMISEALAATLGLIHGATKGRLAGMPMESNPRSQDAHGVVAGAKDTNWLVQMTYELRRGGEDGETPHVLDNITAAVTRADLGCDILVSANDIMDLQKRGFGGVLVNKRPDAFKRRSSWRR